MNWGQLALMALGASIGSFFTHAFHVRSNQLKGIAGALDSLHIKTDQVQAGVAKVGEIAQGAVQQAAQQAVAGQASGFSGVLTELKPMGATLAADAKQTIASGVPVLVKQAILSKGGAPSLAQDVADETGVLLGPILEKL
jgi:hypothetical protein